jgi:hypothetical protein
MYRDKLYADQVVEPIKKTEGNHVSDMVLMLSSRNLRLLNLLVMKVMVLVSNAQADSYENLKDLDKLMVEFMPDPQLRSYMYDRKTVRNVSIGKTALVFYYEDLKVLKSP